MYNEDSERIIGLNRRNRIYVEYLDNEISLKKVICHEILHSFMKGDEITHKIIYNLEESLPCYKNKKVAITLR